MPVRATILLALALLPGLARAEGPAGPVFKDAERVERPFDGAWSGWGRPGVASPSGLPTRRDGGPGYVGSDWGLGRPAYTGLGSRPDWGRSNID